MAAYDPSGTIAFLEKNKASVWPTDTDKCLAEAISRLGGRSSDDKKEATKLAVESAKLLLTIALAVLAATVTLLQFARNSGVAWTSPTIVLFIIVVVALLVSIGCGFHVISRVYKRADGREALDQPAWGTESIKAPLNGQVFAGMAAIFLLLVSLVIWASHTTAPTRLSFSNPAHSLVSDGPVTIDGIWSEISIKGSDNRELKLPASSVPGSQITAVCK